MLCPDCGIELLKFYGGKFVKRCRFCSVKLHQLNAKLKYEKKEKVEKECFGCKKKFSANWLDQKFCGNPCTSTRRSIAEKNEFWEKNKKKKTNRNTRLNFENTRF